MNEDASGLLPGSVLRNWHRFVIRGGEAGRRWEEEYCRPEIFTVEDVVFQALTRFRQHRFAAGLELLRQAEDCLHGLPVTPPVRDLLDRWYQGALSYYWYCTEDFPQAIESLARGSASLVSAITRQRVLVSLANHLIEFELHFARIARNRRRWSEMAGHVEAARAMIQGQIPLCRLAPDVAVHISDVCFYFESIDLDGEERDSIADLLDERARLRAFDRFVARLYALPTFVIPYA